MPEMPAARAARTHQILQRLHAAYPDAACSLRHSNPLELLIATILSAQCTDERVNLVTAALFTKYRTAADYARAAQEALAHDIRQINFFNNTARSIRQACQTLVERFGGRVPDRMDDLLTLHGVARKTANVVLGNAFGIQAGVVVDTHVLRLAQRLGLSARTDRDTIERDLMALAPPAEWTRVSHLLIAHGRAVCKAPTPQCARCPLDAWLCPSYRAEPAAPARRRKPITRSGRPASRTSQTSPKASG